MYDLSTVQKFSLSVVAEVQVDQQLLVKAFHEEMTRQTSHVAQLCLFIYIPFALAWIAYFWYGGSARTYTALLVYSWASMSLGITTLNKTLVMFLNAPCFITVAQMAMTALFVAVVNGKKIQKSIEDHRQQAFRWLIVPILFSGMLMSSIFGFKYMSLSMMTVVRNLAPLVALPIELTVMAPHNHPVVTPGCISSMVVMLVGAVVYGFSAPVFSGIGIFCVLINTALAISDRMVQRRLLSQDCKDLRLEVCMFINNFVGIFPSLAVALATHEAGNSQSHHAAAWYRLDTLAMLLFSGMLGIGMCYFGLAVQRSISATSFLVLNNMSKFAIVLIGVMLFGDPIKSNFTKTGLILSLGGSCGYGWSQIKESSKEATTSSDIVEIRKPLVPGQQDRVDGLAQKSPEP